MWQAFIGVDSERTAWTEMLLGDVKNNRGGGNPQPQESLQGDRKPHVTIRKEKSLLG